MFYHFKYFYPPLCQLFNSATILLSRFEDRTISTTPVFDDDFQRIEGPAEKAKEVSHRAEGGDSRRMAAQGRGYMLDEDEIQF